MRSALSCSLGLVVLLACSPALADVASCLQAAERAQPLRGAGALRQARAELITCSATSCPRAVRADCTRWLTEVETAIPTVVVQAHDASGADIVDVTVSIDGVMQQKALDGLAISVDPGTRVFRFEAQGRASTERTLAIREGEKSRVVPVVLLRPGEQTQRPPAPIGVAEQRRSGVPTATWILGGAGLIAASGGIALWALGTSERSDLRSECASAASCQQSDVDAAKTKLVVGDVLVAAGVLAIAAGVWLALRPSSTSSTVVTVAPRGLDVLGAF